MKIQIRTSKRNWKWTDLREVIGDIEALSNEREQALERLALLGLELTVEERHDADVIGIIVEMCVGADPEHHCRRLTQRLGRRAELRQHFFILFFQF